MRRALSVLVAALVILGLAAPQALAQQAAAPAPKVTISGLVDFVSSIYGNIGDTDITKKADTGWYSRERGVFTITGEIGKSKGVLALEFDIINGFGNKPSMWVTNAGAVTGATNSTTFDIGTDVNDVAELKWLYVETPVTGPGSLVPFIPVETIARLGGQPARGWNDVPGRIMTGDFPGVTLETTWAPNLRTTLAFMQIDEKFDERSSPVTSSSGLITAGTEDFAILVAASLDVFKGFTVSPKYVYTYFDRGSSSGGLGLLPRGGINLAALDSAGNDPRATHRHTIGAEANLTLGPWFLQPGFFYQWGTQDLGRTLSATFNRKELDISAWLLDVIGGFRSGPLTLQGRFTWTPGNKATECALNISGSRCRDINFYEPIFTDTNFYAGWSEIEASNVDYIVQLNPTSGMRLGSSPSYDKYGRIVAALAADYALTPALTFRATTIFQWTDEEVDTRATFGTAGLDPVGGGRARYLGNETNVGFTYRFAPNVAFDFIGAYLWAGEARDHGRTATVTTDSFDAKDVYKVTARMRVTW